MYTLDWRDDHLSLLDQTRLPREEIYLDIYSCEGVADAIRSMRVRGAPALGCAAAYGVALAALAARDAGPAEFRRAIDRAATDLITTRPTAVNIAWAVHRMQVAIADITDPNSAVTRLIEEARVIQEEDVRANHDMGRLGAALLPEQCAVLTHCNAGALATAGYGTALGVIRAAVESGKRVHVFADETRPLLQGARLTTWELTRDGIPTTLIADTMAGYCMRRGQIDCVVVGADRIASNGDVANKIGTYQVAVLARENGIPFYVAAPFSTVDLSIADGDEIQIEQRDAEEVVEFAGVRTAAGGVEVQNPAFDITPNRYVTAIITELGVVQAPYDDGLRALEDAAAAREAQKIHA
jgi:methylthioribose-1-phosphate isomerase